MGSARACGRERKAERQSTCLAIAMPGRRTASVSRIARAVLRGKRRPAAARRGGGRAGALPLAESGWRLPRPGSGWPGAPLAAARRRRRCRLPAGLGWAGLGWAWQGRAGLGRLRSRSRSAPPWPGAPPCGPRRDCARRRPLPALPARTGTRTRAHTRGCRPLARVGAPRQHARTPRRGGKRGEGAARALRGRRWSPSARAAPAAAPRLPPLPAAQSPRAGVRARLPGGQAVPFEKHGGKAFPAAAWGGGSARRD